MLRILTMLMSVLLAAVLPLGAMGADTPLLPVYKHYSQLSSKELMEKGNAFSEHEELQDSALLCYTVVANRYLESKNDRKELEYSVDAYYNIGILYSCVYFDFEKAYQNLQTALYISERYDLSGMMPYLYMALANVNNVSNQTRQAWRENPEVVSLYRKGYESAIANGDWRVAIALVGNIAEYAMLTGNTGSLLAEIKDFARQAVPDMPLLRLTKLKCQMVIACHDGDYKAGIALTDSMPQAIDVDFEPERLMVEVYMFRDQIYHKMGMDEQSVRAMTEACRIAEDNGILDILPLIYGTLERRYLSMGKEPLGRQYHLRYLEAKDSLLTQNKLEDMNELHFHSQLDAVNQQVRELSQKRRTQAVILWSVVGLSVLLAIILVLIVVHNIRLHRKNRELYEKTKSMLASESTERQLRQQLEAQLAEQQESARSMPDTGTRGTLADSVAQNERRSTIDEAETSEVQRAILNVLESSEAIYQADFTMDRLVELTHSKYKTVSEVINQRMGSTFYQLLSDYRMREACRRLSDQEHYGQYTIEAIALSLGLKSRTHFVSQFKKFTGLTPSQYQRMSRK